MASKWTNETGMFHSTQSYMYQCVPGYTMYFRFYPYEKVMDITILGPKSLLHRVNLMHIPINKGLPHEKISLFFGEYGSIKYYMLLNLAYLKFRSVQ